MSSRWTESRWVGMWWGGQVASMWTEIEAAAEAASGSAGVWYCDPCFVLPRRQLVGALADIDAVNDALVEKAWSEVGDE